MNFLWTLSGNVVYAACQWGILVALAKLGTPQMVGEFALALAVTAPIVIGAGLSLRSVQATDALREHKFHDYFSLRLLTTVAAVLAVAGVVWSSGYGTHTAAVILIVGIAKGLERALLHRAPTVNASISSGSVRGSTGSGPIASSRPSVGPSRQQRNCPRGV